MKKWFLYQTTSDRRWKKSMQKLYIQSNTRGSWNKSKQTLHFTSSDNALTRSESDVFLRIILAIKKIE